MTDRYVLDASALLCLFFNEPGAERVGAVLSAALIGTVNYAESIAKMVDLGVPIEQLLAFVAGLSLEIVPLDERTAELAGILRADTRGAGLSLGDRCCLALAKRMGAVALTADRAWAALAVGVRVELLRRA